MRLAGTTLRTQLLAASPSRVDQARVAPNLVADHCAANSGKAIHFDGFISDARRARLFINSASL